VFPNERRRELVTALLEYGYDSFGGEALPPQRVCPFPVSEAARDGERFRNGEAKAAETSFAIVGEGGCYLWSVPQR
jgi:hypothetical protein